MRTVVVGVAGGSASGKTTVVARLVAALRVDSTIVIAHDRYYRDRSTLPLDERAALNYDHPDALDSDLLVAHLHMLRSGSPIEAPQYDFTRHQRRSQLERLDPGPVVIVEGILVLADPRLRAAMDLKVFVDTDDETRLHRRLERDILERGRTAESVIEQYIATVRPMHAAFVEPTRKYADVIVADGGFNDEGVDQVITSILSVLQAL